MNLWEDESASAATMMTLRMHMMILSEPTRTPATTTAGEAVNECTD
jgi:hypothetical protein